MSDANDDFPTEARDLDTVPRGLEPPPLDPHDAMEGAPGWAKAIFDETLRGREVLKQVLANQEAFQRQFANFREEVRGHLRGHDEDILHLNKRTDSLERRMDSFEVRIGENYGRSTP